MSKELATTELTASTMEAVIVGGDLSKLSPAQRLSYYHHVCESVGLNPLTKPFEYIRLNNRLTLYARKDATEQLRRRDGVSIGKPELQFQDDLVIVTVIATNEEGRTDTDIGAVSLGNLRGEAKANAIMKAITKAKRRVTLSICGLGWTDESEIETIPTAEVVTVDHVTGEIVEPEHWIEDPTTRKRFWHWVKQVKALGEKDVHTALGVESVKDYAGSKEEAITAIETYIDAQIAADAAKIAAEVVEDENPALDEEGYDLFLRSTSEVA